MNQQADRIVDSIYNALKQRKQLAFQGHPGLYNGTLGVSLFLYHFGSSEEWREPALDDADAYLANAISKLHSIDNDSFSSGIFGLGWGIDYLIDREYVEANSNALSQVDSILMDYNVFNNKLDVSNGTLGYAIYLASRYDKIYLPGGRTEERIRHSEKCETMIRFIDQIEVNVDMMFNKWDIQVPADMNNFFFIDLKFLNEFIHGISSCFYFLKSIEALNLYPQIIDDILDSLKAKLSICIAWCETIIDDLAVRSPTQINQLLESLLVLANIVSDFREVFSVKIDDWPDKIVTAFIGRVSTYENPCNVAVQLLIRLYHRTGSAKALEFALELADHRSKSLIDSIHGNGDFLGLKHGIAGLGLSLLAIKNPELTRWDRCLGLS